MKILVTGSTGFVGRNLIPYLRDSGYSEFILGGREFFKRLDTSDIADADVVIHLAGKAHDLKKVSEPEEYYAANYETTKRLYDAFLKSNATKFIFISSVKASADSVKGVLTEVNLANPHTHYGKSKLKAENYITSIVLPQNKRYYILRPCMIHGPGNKGNLNLLYQLVRRGIPYPLAAFNNQRSYLSVKNLCFVIKEITERDDISSGIYQVSDDQTLSTTEVVEVMAKVMGKEPKLWAIPASFMRMIAKAGSSIGFPLNVERLNKLTEDYRVSNQKIKHALGKSLPFQSIEGLIETFQSFGSEKSDK